MNEIKRGIKRKGNEQTEELCKSQLVQAVVPQRDDTLWFVSEMTVVIKTTWGAFSVQHSELEAALWKGLQNQCGPRWLSNRDHISETGPQLDLRDKAWKTSCSLTQIYPERLFSKMSSDPQQRQSRISTTFCKSMTWSTSALILSAGHRNSTEWLVYHYTATLCVFIWHLGWISFYQITLGFKVMSLAK